MTRIHVALHERSYDILIARSYAPLPAALHRLGLGPDLAIITNRTVLSRVGTPLIRLLQRQGFVCEVALLPDTERAKSWAWTGRLLTAVNRRFRGRVPTILAVGGGVVGDAAGFAASILRRGVPLVQVPTTLLAQVDSAIGGKTAIDLPAGKNLVGAFYQPRLVFSNVAVLRSLDLRQRRSGLAEVVKYGVMADRRLLAYVERHAAHALRAEPRVVAALVADCSRIKARLVSRDEREARGERTVLNFGHTLGHGLEAATAYSHQYTHGEAIAIGMLAAGEIAVRLRYWPLSEQARLETLIRRLGLPTRARDTSVARICAAMRYDKKSVAGALRWVLPTRIGHAVVAMKIPIAIVRDAMSQRLSRRPHGVLTPAT